MEDRKGEQKPVEAMLPSWKNNPKRGMYGDIGTMPRSFPVKRRAHAVAITFLAIVAIIILSPIYH